MAEKQPITSQPNGKRPYQWAIGILVGLCCLFGGVAIGRQGSVTKQDMYEVSASLNSAMVVLANQLTEHVRIDGHPVMVERVARIEAAIREEFSKVNAKLDELLAK